MILFDIITWPVRALFSLLSSLLRLTLSICLFPFRLAASIARSLWIKVCYVFQYAENKLSILKTWKPFCYLFPLTPVNDSSGPINQNEGESSEMKGNLKSREYKSRSPSPDEIDEGQTISSLIQDLLKISQTETQPQERSADKIQLLLQELNELAAAGGLTGNNDDAPAGASPRVSVLLEDLSTLESYLTQFISDDEEGHLPLPPDRMSSLETILEETASKESSPLHCRSPLPHKGKKPHPLAVQTIEEERELTHSQNEISQTLLLLQKVAKSHELKQSLQQMSDMHRQEEEEEETTPTTGEGVGSDQEKTPPGSARERRESLKNQLDSSQNELDSLISSLDQHQKFMSSQRELQEAMDSLVSEWSRCCLGGKWFTSKRFHHLK
ncbi:PREDICTED: uncharacterized protein LOC109587771 [Amphimedon queenslandica]|uniref:Uncharacterized protein n=1 Tax=Amphimedon queenslandica TaxID=400682 RepID=A0AAN0JRS9_AMPQE|nr:PREDICTED: uncharacterized protein LOC109587771 [Amphimedon queenslandica]|eukprot:XP_019859552.1 PREDICTED: uncharacterized protein LOC109587771 [Amphimedon queenslandica]